MLFPRRSQTLIFTAFFVAAGVLGSALVRPANASPPGAGWNRVFLENFDGTKLNANTWSKNYAQAPYNYLDHQAWMSPDQVKVSGGNLFLTAIKQHNPAAPNSYRSGSETIPLDYTSGAINSKGKFSISAHGHDAYVEARIQVPSTIGTWPAFWLMPDKGGWPPEIDILEMPVTRAADRKRARYNYHYGPDGAHQQFAGGTYISTIDYSQTFHTYGVAWGTNYMTWYVDDKQIARIDNPNIAQAQAMYIILNLGVGGWAETPPSSSVFPSKMRVDWVRAYQQSASNTASSQKASTDYLPKSVEANVADRGSDSITSSMLGVPKLTSVGALLTGVASVAMRRRKRVSAR